MRKDKNRLAIDRLTATSGIPTFNGLRNLIGESVSSLGDTEITFADDPMEGAHSAQTRPLPFLTMDIARYSVTPVRATVPATIIMPRTRLMVSKSIAKKDSDWP